MAVTAPTLDLNDAAFLADPYPAYARLRAAAPVMRFDATSWLVLRHADVSTLLHDRRLASGPLNTALYDALPDAALAEVEPFRANMGHNMLLQDPPEHTRLRRLVSQAFTPRRVEALRATVERIASELLAEARSGDRLDVIADLGFPLAARVIASLLGVPWSDLHLLKAWNDDGAELLGTARTAPDPVGLARRVGASYRAMRAYLERLVAEHRRSPGDDLICALIAVEDGGERLSEEELYSTCGLLFAAGHETTTNAIGNGLLALLRHPEQRALLRDEPTLWHVAVDELARDDSPAQFLWRAVVADVEVGGVTLRAGELAMLVLASGNRDPEAFPDPDRLDLRRQPRQYLTFGIGLHACLGAFLARLETEVALSTLLGRFPELRLIDEPLRWRPNPIFRGLERLPIVL